MVRDFRCALHCSGFFTVYQGDHPDQSLQHYIGFSPCLSLYKCYNFRIGSLPEKSDGVVMSAQAIPQCFASP